MMRPSAGSTDAGAAAAALPLLGRRVQIAGSASGRTDPALIGYAHELVRQSGEGCDVRGRRDRGRHRKRAPPGWRCGGRSESPVRLDGIEAAAECLRQGFRAWPARYGLPIVVASSEKAELEIPECRRALYEGLLRSGLLRVESIMPGSRAAVFLRQRQAVFGDALVILGGGTGVEHSADMYLSRRKPVVPLDLALGASRDDGTGGAMRLAKEARTEPDSVLPVRAS